MNDRFAKGCIIGFIGALTVIVIDYTLYYGFHFSDYRLLDFGSILVFSRFPTNYQEMFFAQLVQMFHAILKGIVFVYFIAILGKEHIFLKGIAYAIFAWMFLWTMILLFEVSGLTIMTYSTVVSTFIISLGFGLVISITYQLLENKLIKMK